MSLHESLWSYQRYRYLKAAAALLLAACAVYAAWPPPGGHHGGTWYGYALGALSLALIVWLMWFGVRKRSYGTTQAPLRGWLSAHVYLGIVLVLLVPLHSGFQFGWNVHTLAYVLMCAVIASGGVGVIFYTSIPRQMTENRPGEKLEGLIERIADLDTECRALALGMPDAIASAVAVAIHETSIGGGMLRQLAGADPRCGTARALDLVSGQARALEGRERDDARKLLEVLALKRGLLGRVRRDVRLKALLDLWLIAHVPLAFATFAAVAVHVFVVFYYR